MIMEGFARCFDADGELWATLGLLSVLDLEYVDQNPLIRGRVASEKAELEGLDPRLCEVLERWPRGPEPEAHADTARLQDALALTDALARDWSEIGARSPEELAAALGQDLRLRSEQGDSVGDRLYDALQRLSITAEEAAGVAVEALTSLSEARP